MPEPELEVEEIEAEEPAPTPEGFIPLDKHQKDVNVQHKKFRDEERQRVKAEERAKAAERELEELRRTNDAVEIPPIPDRYSDTYEQEIVARDKAIAAKTAQDAEIQQREAEQRKEDEQRTAAENKAIADKVATFDSNMVALGLNPVEVKAAADTVIANGASGTLQDILLEDPEGALIVEYFAANPLEQEKVNGMSALGVINHINNEVRAKAALLRPKTSNAPNPPVVLDGGGAPKAKESWEKGAKYE